MKTLFYCMWELAEMGCGNTAKASIHIFNMGLRVRCLGLFFWYSLLGLPAIRFWLVNAVSHEATSRILEDIILEFGKKNITIPEKVMGDLRAARTLMKIQNASPSAQGETAPKIEAYLGSVEAYLVTEGANHFASEKVDGWLRKLEIATCNACVTVVEPKEESRFVAGVPRDQKWVRVKPEGDLSLEKVKQVAAEAGLGFREEKDGQLVVHGKDMDVKAFIKKIAADGKKPA